MFNDKIALTISTRDYAEVITSPNNFGALVITAAVENQIVQINFPKDPFKDGVFTRVLVGNPSAINTILDGELYGKYSRTEVDKSMADCSFTCFSDKETPDASMLALEEVLPSDRLNGTFMDYSGIFHEFVALRTSKISEYMRDIDDTCSDQLFCSIAHHMSRWLTTRMITSVNNVRELVRACKVCDAYFCRSIRWLLSEAECYSCDVDTSKLSDRDIWFKEYVADPILSQYCGNGRVPVWKLLNANIPLSYLYSAETFKYKLKLCGVDIHYIK